MEKYIQINIGSGNGLLVSCGDCQIWMWFINSNMYFYKFVDFPSGARNEREFSSPHPRAMAGNGWPDNTARPHNTWTTTSNTIHNLVLSKTVVQLHSNYRHLIFWLAKSICCKMHHIVKKTTGGVVWFVNFLMFNTFRILKNHMGIIVFV